MMQTRLFMVRCRLTGEVPRPAHVVGDGIQRLGPREASDVQAGYKTGYEVHE
jgi:hypothetical protein